jgi:pyruvate dehydrogenase kinase 2/3/4
MNSLNSKHSSAPPPVDILIAGGAHGVCIKVSDQAGGMTRDQANALFSYVQPTNEPSAAAGSLYDPISAALERRASGIDIQKSFGLRIASLYAQYFGGALSLMPMEGHGVDTYIYMKCLTEDSQLK